MKNYKGKVMILGASYSQIPLMEAAKRLGYEAIAVSIPGNYAGFPYADRIIYADITDPEAVLAAAREEDVDGITTCCMDVGIRALGYACETLGLPGPNTFGTLAACDKSIEKEAYLKAGVTTAPYALVSSREELKEALKNLRFPVIIKAVDLMGSKGIFRSDTEEEALANLPKSLEASKKDFCIVEEFIEGTMFGVEAMMSQGRLAYALPLGNVMRQGNPTFPIGHYVPYACGEDAAFQTRVEEEVLRVAKALGFDNCGMDLDCMYKDGEIYIIEATARAGATCITDTVSIYYGIDYYEALVKASLGIDVYDMFHGSHVPEKPSITRLLSVDKEGELERIVVPENLPESVRDLSFNIDPGDHVAPMINGALRAGQLIVSGESLDACRETMDQVLSDIHYEIKTLQ